MHPRGHLIHIVWWDAQSSGASTCLLRYGYASFQAALSGAFQLPAKEGNDHVATMPGRRPTSGTLERERTGQHTLGQKASNRDELKFFLSRQNLSVVSAFFLRKCSVKK